MLFLAVRHLKPFRRKALDHAARPILGPLIWSVKPLQVKTLGGVEMCNGPRDRHIVLVLVLGR
jgi:hypothetical protein